MSSRAARDALVIQHAAWARKLALVTRRRRNLRLSHDDTISAAYLALVEVAGRYRPGVLPFHAFAYRRIVGAVLDQSYQETIDAGRSRSPDGKRRFRPEPIDLGVVVDRLRDQQPSPYDHAVAAEGMRRVLHLLASLPPREACALRLYCIEGLTLAEAGRRLGVGETRVCQPVRAGARRIRDGTSAASG